jgi:hypothetical protein
MLDWLQSTGSAHSLPTSEFIPAPARFTSGNLNRQWANFLVRYNPITSSGRDQIRRTVFRSDPAYHKASSGSSLSSGNPLQRYAGWRMGTRLCCFAVLACLIVEAVILTWMLASTVGGKTGSDLLYEGNCEKVKSMAVWLLLPLNIVATILISTSNYVMQCMAAPDRKEIDYAHSLGTPVTIGGMRLRNLQFGDHRRRILWWLLILSSLPIHLLLNSAIFASLELNNTGILIVSEDFETDRTWKSCNSTLPVGELTTDFACWLMEEFRTNKTVQMAPEQCINQFGNAFQANSSSVIVVAEDSPKQYYSLPDPGPIGHVGAEQGILCDADATGLNYFEVPEAEQHYILSFNPELGNVTVSTPFYVQCSNASGILMQGTNLSIYSDTSGLFLTSQSALLNVNSVRSVFSAFEYGYWATAQLLDNQLDTNNQTLTQDWDPRTWLCPNNDLKDQRGCDSANLLLEGDEWTITPSNISVKACHVLPAPERCKLIYSPTILAVAIGVDAIKLIVMIIAVRITMEPLATIGDAIASFLERPDIYTEDKCLLNVAEARNWSKEYVELIKSETLKATFYQKTGAKPSDPTKILRTQTGWGGDLWSRVLPCPITKYWKRQQHRWASAPSRSRWVYFVS